MSCSTKYQEESVNEEKEVDAIADLLADVVEKDSTDLNLPNPILDRIEGMDFRGPVLAQFAKKDQELISSYLDDLMFVNYYRPVPLHQICMGEGKLMVKL